MTPIAVQKRIHQMLEDGVEGAVIAKTFGVPKWRVWKFAEKLKVYRLGLSESPFIGVKRKREEYLPTPQEIAARAALIRSTWTDGGGGGSSQVSGIRVVSTKAMGR